MIDRENQWIDVDSGTDSFLLNALKPTKSHIYYPFKINCPFLLVRGFK